MTSPTNTELHALEALLSYQDREEDERRVREHMREHTHLSCEHGNTTLSFTWKKTPQKTWYVDFSSRSIKGKIAEDLATELIRVYLWDKKGCLPHQMKNDE